MSGENALSRSTRGVKSTAVEADQRSISINVTLGTAGKWFVPIPFTGEVERIYTAISGALATANEALTIKDAGGNGMGTITITQSGSAEGDMDTLAPSVSNAFAAGDSMEIETNGGNSNAENCTITILFRLT